jgi:hypothetical protein
MKVKILISTTIILLCLAGCKDREHIVAGDWNCTACVATYPAPVRIKQADDTRLTLRSRGDEVELHYLYLIYMRSEMEPAARNGVL